MTGKSKTIFPTEKSETIYNQLVPVHLGLCEHNKASSYTDLILPLLGIVAEIFVNTTNFPDQKTKEELGPKTMTITSAITNLLNQGERIPIIDALALINSIISVVKLIDGRIIGLTEIKEEESDADKFESEDSGDLGQDSGSTSEGTIGVD